MDGIQSEVVSKGQKLFDILCDGEWHRRSDLILALDISGSHALRTYISVVRRKQAVSHGALIICELKARTLGYRLTMPYERAGVAKE